jgi:hypothetical protein
MMWQAHRGQSFPYDKPYQLRKSLYQQNSKKYISENWKFMSVADPAPAGLRVASLLGLCYTALTLEKEQF